MINFYKHILYRLSTLFFLYCLSQPFLYANGVVIEYADTSEKKIIGDQVYTFEDHTNSLNIQDIARQPLKHNINLVPNFGVSESTFWVQFTIINHTQKNKLLLEISQPIIDDITLYTPLQGSYTSQNAGDKFPFTNRFYQYPNFVFDLNIKPEETKTFYLKVKSEQQILLPLTVGTSKVVLEGLHKEAIFFGIYFGIMLVMFLYNMFIFFTVRDKTYLYYVIHTLFIGLTQSALMGYPFQFLWPQSPEWANLSVYIFPCCVGITGLEFLKNFLNTKEVAPRLHKISFIITGLYMLTAVLSLVGKMHIAYTLVQGCAAVVAIFMLVVAIVVTRTGSKPAKFFLIAWSAMLVGIIIFVLKDFGILAPNPLTNYTMPVGSALETILLSFALADRINILKKEKEESQAQVVIALQENEKLIREQNIILEQKVDERTTELAKANQVLNTTLKDLKNTQAQLVDAEKMASLGQLTAGIAHEINNPINFVSANIKPLQMDINDIIEVISKYENISPADNLPEKLQEINAFKKQIDLEYTKTEIQTLLAGIEDGAKRTAEIVTGLKTFSRLDESDVKTANINDGIESTLTMIRSTIPENINVIKHLQQLPIIECFPGKLNQVFMNTFNNAIHAMQEKKVGGTLTISSYVADENHIGVSIEDTGIGMTPETKLKIFEPFFTTKDVGQGTGLGMSIVFTIIESHHGVIDIETEYGKGTKIIITLPMKLTVS
ncbi:MAG TPA: 7TM diverse intracellular signaling domain-containing protein [Cytophagaceae bacterium]|jgi:two-component system NtrC family sensor kinase|nr:7TM diverse intracellular signaling domain-containing protein [Cytophagaceae bacterium]